MCLLRWEGSGRGRLGGRKQELRLGVPSALCVGRLSQQEGKQAWRSGRGAGWAQCQHPLPGPPSSIPPSCRPVSPWLPDGSLKNQSQVADRPFQSSDFPVLWLSVRIPCLARPQPISPASSPFSLLALVHTWCQPQGLCTCSAGFWSVPNLLGGPGHGSSFFWAPVSSLVKEGSWTP